MIYIFVLWMLWKIVKSLNGINASNKGIDESLKLIADSLKNKS